MSANDQDVPPAPPPAGRRTALALVVAALLAASSGVVAVWNSRQAIGLEEQVQHALRLMLALDGVQVQTLNMQTGSRGYLLSGDEDFLERFNTGKKQLRDSLQDVRLMMAHIPAQQERLRRLEPLVLRAMQLFETRVQLRREQGLEASLAAAPLSEGKAIVDEITALIVDMTMEENLLLAERSARRERRNSAVLAAIIGSITFATGLVFLSLWNLRRSPSP